MQSRTTPQLPASTRDLRRDRSILALAAALCGALAAAGVAGAVITSQIYAGHEQEALSDVTAALSSAREELELSRETLEQTRAQLADVSAVQAPETKVPGCRHRSQRHPQKPVPAAFIVQTTRPRPMSFVSTFHFRTDPAPAMRPAALHVRAPTALRLQRSQRTSGLSGGV